MTFTKASLRVAALVVACSAVIQGQEHRTVSVTTIGHVLHCLKSKLADYDYAPPMNDGSHYRVRYFYGIQHPWTDEDNELHLLVYGNGEQSATLYEVYFESIQRKPVITIGLIGKLNKQRSRLVAEHIEFGIGTYDRIQKLSHVIGLRPAVIIPERYVKPGKDACDRLLADD